MSAAGAESAASPPASGGRISAESLVLAAVALLALPWPLAMLDAPLHGDDERMLLEHLSRMGAALPRLNFFTIADEFLHCYHPPGRLLAAFPFTLLFGPEPWSLRLPNLFGWVLTGVFAARVGNRLGGPWIGFASGAFLALSGLFDLMAMGHGHTFPTLFVMILADRLVRRDDWPLANESQRFGYQASGLCCVAGFCWFTTVLPVAGMFHLTFAWTARRRLRAWIADTAPFALFYPLYYLLFLGIPFAMVMAGDDEPFGQLAQNLGRARDAAPDLLPVVENLRALNWYVLPFASWAILPLALWRLARRHPRLLAILLPYGLIFSFAIHGNTAQHFFSFFCWMTPFAFAELGAVIPRLRRSLFAVLLLLVAGFAWYGHVRRYTGETFPRPVVEAVWGKVLWPNNQR